MEFGLREWMILIGGLLILAVIVDGVRRVFFDRRNTIRMGMSHQGYEEGGEGFNPELPNGGARSVERSEFETVRTRPRYPEAEKARAAPAKEPDEDSPRHEPVPPPEGELLEPEPAPELLEPEPAAPVVAREEQIERLNPQPDEVLVINVLSRDKNGFNGADLLEVLLACDVRFGSMDIFHRYEGAQGQGRIQFSVANLVKPGTFDLDSIKEFYTPGVCMFLQLPGPKDSLAAFDCMAEIAACIVKNLQGELRDDRQSVLTPQTIEHYRERIRDFERKRLTRTAHRSA
jgi:cell division protein ZipA